MNIAEQLASLHALHERGALNDEEFTRAKAQVLNGSTPPCIDAMPAAINTLRRSRDERWLGGVCGGLAHATGIEVWVWRLAFCALTLLGGAGVLLYLLLWIFVPLA
jgi:phage shock protein C